MELWLLRHAEAEDRTASGKDEDRGLTADGLLQAKSVARGLAALEPGITLILTSPYRRARQTAARAAEALRPSGGVRESRALAPGNEPAAVLAELSDLKEESALLVGHAPLLGFLLGRLVTGEPRREIPLSKTGAAWISWQGVEHRGRLRAFLPPRVLERLGGVTPPRKKS
jgi:phosphohistidine phosphatase